MVVDFRDRKKAEWHPLIIYADLIDVQQDFEGNCHIILRKHRIESMKVSIDKLKEVLGKSLKFMIADYHGDKV